VVYFLWIEQGEYMSIKIGYSSNYDNRLSAHSLGLGVKPKIRELAVVRGNRNDEQHIHNYFIKHLIPGKTEEFYPHAELCDYVRWLRDQRLTWVPDSYVRATDDMEREVLKKIESHPNMLREADSEEWYPKPDRRVTLGQSLLDVDACEFPMRLQTPDDFYTNPIIIQAAQQTMGEIDLDPASCPEANSVVCAKTIFTSTNSGLVREWFGRVWLNPPFSEWADWTPKVISELAKGRIESMCVLCACRTLTAKYFRPLKDKSDAICILDGRVPFWGGKATSSPDDGHVIFYFGKDYDRFKTNFAPLGNVWRSV
jgi:hypothetical protein